MGQRQKLGFTTPMVRIDDSESTGHSPIVVVQRPRIEAGIATLIGVDDAEVAQNEYSNSIEEALGATMTGRVTQVSLVFHEGNTGQIITEAGILLFMDADPDVSAGDTLLAADGAEHATVFGQVNVAGRDDRTS